MKPRFTRAAALRSRGRRASTLGLFLTLFAVGRFMRKGHPQGPKDLGSPDRRKARRMSLGLPR